MRLSETVKASLNVPLQTKLVLIILDGLPWRNWQPFTDNLEDWVHFGTAMAHALGAAVNVGALLRVDPYWDVAAGT
jgi:hypothetical protein